MVSLKWNKDIEPWIKNEYHGDDEGHVIEDGPVDYDVNIETESEFSFDSAHENEYSERWKVFFL